MKSSNSFNTFGHCHFAWLSFTVKHSAKESTVLSTDTFLLVRALCTSALNRHFIILNHIDALSDDDSASTSNFISHFLLLSSSNTHFKSIDQKLCLIFRYYLHFSQKHTLLLIFFHSPVRFRFICYDFFLYFFLIGKLFL